MSEVKWQNIAGSRNCFSHNFKAQKINEVVNLSFLAMFTDTRNHLNTIKKHKHLEIKENNLQIIIH